MSVVAAAGDISRIGAAALPVWATWALRVMGAFGFGGAIYVLRCAWRKR